MKYLFGIIVINHNPARIGIKMALMNDDDYHSDDNSNESYYKANRNWNNVTLLTGFKI